VTMINTKNPEPKTENRTPSTEYPAHISCLQLIKKAQAEVTRLDAEIMLSYLLGVQRAGLYIYEGNINNEVLKKFRIFIEERTEGRPLQYIIGKTEFMGYEFAVTPDVLIPRPETELLVEKAIEAVKGIKAPVILDLGTGSGNIAIALTKFITDCKIIGSDISKQALFVAKRNARLNQADADIEFVLSDLFEDLAQTKYNLIISNPPYVASPHIRGLKKEISFEPRIALDGGQDGLDFYRRLIKDSGRFLIKEGFLMVEVGFDQADEVKALFKKSGFIDIRYILDYNHIKRIVVAQWIG